MRRFAKLVLHHQILVVVVWVVLAVAGVISIKPVNDRLTIDFFLPGQPGTQAARQIISDFGNGGSPSPYLVVFTAPDGQSVTGHEQAHATAFTSVATAAPNLRLVDEATSGNKVFRSKDDRTSYAMVFYNRGNNPSARPPPPLLLITMAKSSAPSGWTKGVTGEDVVSAGDSSASGPGVLGETLFGAFGAAGAAGAVHAQRRYRRGADPARERPHHADPDTGHPQLHRAEGRLAQGPPREPGQPPVVPLGRRGGAPPRWCAAAGSPPPPPSWPSVS